MNQVILSGLSTGSAYVLMSLGFALAFELAGLVNAAHGAFVVAGMYVVLELVEGGLTPWLAIPVAGLAIGLASIPVYGLLIGPARRHDGQGGHRAQLIYTLLLLSALTVLYQLIFGADIRTLDHDFQVLSLAGASITSGQAVTVVVAILAPIALFVGLKRTKVGKITYAAGHYELGALSIGASLSRIYIAVFTLSGLLAGLSGGLVVTFQSVTPTSGLEFTVTTFLVALVARTNLLGCLLVGLAYGETQAFMNRYTSANVSTLLVLGALLLALLLQTRFAGLRGLSAR
jgi:branched-subunit amino acid ABC-type transport system permease component